MNGVCMRQSSMSRSQLNPSIPFYTVGAPVDRDVGAVNSMQSRDILSQRIHAVSTIHVCKYAMLEKMSGNLLSAHPTRVIFFCSSPFNIHGEPLSPLQTPILICNGT
jgi:hypothetical protein